MNIKHSKNSLQLKYLLISIVCACSLVGCIAKPPALTTDMHSINVSKESIALFSVKISNKYRPSYQPEIKLIHIKKTDDNEIIFDVADKYDSKEDVFNSYLLSIKLPPGTYTLKELSAKSGIFPISGQFTAPINRSFSINKNQIIYLGHIEAFIKKRANSDELRAGSIIPLIDQAVVGASGGTFVVRIIDKFDGDIQLFKDQYPFLLQYDIGNHTL